MDRCKPVESALQHRIQSLTRRPNHAVILASRQQLGMKVCSQRGGEPLLGATMFAHWSFGAPRVMALPLGSQLVAELHALGRFFEIALRRLVRKQDGRQIAGELTRL